MLVLELNAGLLIFYLSTESLLTNAFKYSLYFFVSQIFKVPRCG
jgi:hypothetical protein